MACSLVHNALILWLTTLPLARADDNYPGRKGAASKKQASPGLNWLTEFTLPVPKSAYDSQQAQLDARERHAFNVLLWDINWWRTYFRSDDWTEEEIEDPCVTSLGTRL
jgi:hypothetical protein